MENQLFEFACQLMNMLDRFEAFALRQFDQLESRIQKISSQLKTTLPDQDLTSAMDNVCQEELLRLQQDSERLIEAWEELEDEQRQLLAARSIGHVIGQVGQMQRTGGSVATKVSTRLNEQKLPKSLRPSTEGHTATTLSSEQFAMSKLRAAVRSFGQK